jgi:predicted nucleic acid-binding protein
VRFWDASALVPLVVDEPTTDLLRGLFMADKKVIVWWVTPVECAAALSRRHREGGLSVEIYEYALKVLVGESAGWRPVAPTELVREEAMRAVRLHALKAGDALQLAAARAWAQQRPAGHALVSLDEKLRRAAAVEGFTILPE